MEGKQGLAGSADLSAVSWWVAGPLAAVPAFLAGCLIALMQTNLTFLHGALLVWGLSAAACAFVLEVWHSLTKRFDRMTLGRALVLGAAFGAVAALLTAKFPNRDLALNAASALGGALQGATTTWLVARPDLGTPTEPNEPSSSTQVDEGDAPPNPPTSAS